MNDNERDQFSIPPGIIKVGEEDNGKKYGGIYRRRSCCLLGSGAGRGRIEKSVVGDPTLSVPQDDHARRGSNLHERAHP